MAHTVDFIIVNLIVLVIYLYQIHGKRGAAVQKRGCYQPSKLHSFDPFFGVDVDLLAVIDIPYLLKHHRKLGKTFESSALVGLPGVYTIATDNIRVVNTNGKVWGIEPFRLPGMEHLCGRGFLTTDGEIWNHSRKLLKPTFARSNLLDLSTVGNELDNLIESLPTDGTTVDLQPLLSTMFLATSMKFLLGILPNSESTRSPYRLQTFLPAFHNAVSLTMFRVLLGRLWKIVPKTAYLRDCQMTHDLIDFYINEALDSKSTSGDSEGDKSAMTSKNSLVHSLSSQTDDRLHIRGQIIQGMLASGETISALLGNTLLLLSRHPVYWQRIRDECLAGSDTSDFDTLLNFTLVQNIFRESMRLYPVFPVLARVALCDTTLPVGGGNNQDESIYVPKGAQVSMSYFALHRDPAVFGADVEEFRPERWDHIKPDQWEYLPFGGGNRACLGQQKVLVEAAYVILRMASTFDKLECQDDLPWKGELKLTCKSAHGCKVSLHK